MKDKMPKIKIIKNRPIPLKAVERQNPFVLIKAVINAKSTPTDKMIKPISLNRFSMTNCKISNVVKRITIDAIPNFFLMVLIPLSFYFQDYIKISLGIFSSKFLFNTQ